MVKKASAEEGTKVEREPFDLKLPAEINPAPWQIVDLPRNKVANIYMVNTPSKDGMPSLRYDVYVVSKKTGAAASRDVYYQGRASASFENIPALKHWLYDIVAQLSIKRSTIKKVRVEDLSDVDDDDE